MARIYGYCRISTQAQSIDRQIRNIKSSYPAAITVAEAYTGTKIHRPEWDKLLKTVEAGDTIVFDSVSRMSRNAEDGVKVYMELYNKGVELVFLKEHHIDTKTYKTALQNQVQLTGGCVDLILEGVNKYLMELAKEQIRLAFAQAEKEVEDLHIRTVEGMETARLNGKQIGQVKGAKLHTKKSDTVKAVIMKHSKDFGGNLSDMECAMLAGCTRNTYYKYKKELKNQ